VGNLVYTSGYTGRDPITNKIPQGIEAQTRQVIANLQAALETTGASLKKVFKCTIYLKDMEDYATFNKVYGEYFNEESYPARTCVQVTRMPTVDALVEIEAIAEL
jgi:2-iminobutanoate/2-iminopropanoate deaminase